MAHERIGNKWLYIKGIYYSLLNIFFLKWEWESNFKFFLTIFHFLDRILQDPGLKNSYTYLRQICTIFYAHKIINFQGKASEQEMLIPDLINVWISFIATSDERNSYVYDTILFFCIY